MERCAVCGAEEFIPYVCRYCGRVHCVYHRLPENHECPNIQQARAPKPIIRVERRSSGTNLRLISAPKLASISCRELYALSTGLLVLSVSFSMRYVFGCLRLVKILEVFHSTMLVLAAFNMIPFFILDGQKVFPWDRRVWAAVAIPLWIAVAVSVFRVF